MPDVEFLPEGQDGGIDAPSRDRGPGLRRALAGGAVLALVAVAAVVISTGGGKTPDRHPRAATTITASSSPSPVTSTLSLPDSVVFGPQAVDVLAVGNEVFALTPTLVGMTDRDGGPVTTRPTPLGLSNRAGYGKLVPDLVNHTLWVVAIGGQTIGAYDTEHLDTLADSQSPYPINGAVAMDEKLWFTTDHGMYVAEAGAGKPTLVGKLKGEFGAIVAVPGQHVVVVANRQAPVRLHITAGYGQLQPIALNAQPPISMIDSDESIWIAGHAGPSAQLFRMNTATWTVVGTSPLTAQLGNHPTIVAAYGKGVLVRGYPGGHSLYCIDSRDGSFKQKWTVPLGAVTLTERGVLLASSQGIRQYSARDCLSG